VVFKENRTKKEKAFTFVWVGTISDDDVVKNLLFLIDCFLDVQIKNKYTRLFIRASGNGLKQIEDKIRESGSENIKIIEWVENLPSFLSTVQCGVFPLVRKTRYNAAKSPGKLFEYMSMELPVICSDFGESRFIVKDGFNGLLASGRKEFAEKMLLLSKDRYLCKKLGKNARKIIVEKYDRPLLMAAYKKIIDRL
jgi:glycosyltransferase involved in cell wall biosynthesis